MVTEILYNLEKSFNASPIIGLGVSFIAGVIASFSPCIYPLIPITLSIMGAASARSRAKGFAISFIFVLGIATIYTVLGILASFFGILLGKFFVNPITYLVLAFFFCILGLSSFELIRFNFLFYTPNYNSKKGFISLFALGVVSGFGLIPCNLPVLGSIMSLISLKKNIFYGALALFLFSLGYGFLLLILGTFASLTRKLPKEGLWLIISRKIIGFVLIAMALYFLIRFLTIIR